MAREHRVIAALGPTAVPVPAVVALCEDPTVTGAPFFVMDHVDGLVLRDRAAAALLPGQPARRRAGEDLVDTLVALHAVEPAHAGLGDLGRRDGYVARQLRRWHGQWQQSRTRPLPAIDEVHARLSARPPDQQGSTIVHGDYRLDNTIVGPDGRVAAVLDWELCTLGDPLADVGLLLVYWAEPGDAVPTLPSGASAEPGFPSRAELRDRYAQRSGRDPGRPRRLRRAGQLEARDHPGGRPRPLHVRCLRAPRPGRRGLRQTRPAAGPGRAGRR
jgi:aminoglycoside phosphotransferase (APT) family kinase protein